MLIGKQKAVLIKKLHIYWWNGEKKCIVIILFRKTGHASGCQTNKAKDATAEMKSREAAEDYT